MPQRVVTTMPLPASAREALAAAAGADAVLVDVKQADGTEDVVVTSAVSHQLLGQLRHAFPDARILVVEIQDEEHGIALGGPVSRAIDAGADGYVVAASLDQLAAAIRAPAAERAPAALTEGADDELVAILDAIAVRTRER